MPTYNGAKYLKEQIDSILLQLSPNDEVIISDDGSTDQTLSILAAYNDDRIKIFHHTKTLQKYNLGYTVANVENALFHAKGDIIFLTDQDDVWLPNKVSDCINALQSADLVVHDAIVTDDELNVLTSSYFKMRGVRKGFLPNFLRNGYMGCCMAFNKHILEYTLPFPDDIGMHDIWIGLRTELKGRVTLIEKPLILHRRHGNNASRTSERSNLTLSQKLLYRFNILKSLVSR